MWQAVNSKNYRERKKLKGAGQQLQPTSNKMLLVKAKQVQVNGMDLNDVLFFVGNVHDSGQVWCRLSERPGVMGDKSSFKHGEITWGGKTIVRASFSNRPALSLHCPDARVCATCAVHLVLPGEQAKRRPDSWHCCTATQRRLGYSLHERWQVG